MLKQDLGGRIISISSINALSGGVTSAVSKHAYAAAKAGKCWASPGRWQGTRSQSVGEWIARALSQPTSCAVCSSSGGRITAGIALGRIGTPEDVASIVRYLAVEAHMFITGQHFVVDGFQWSC